MLNEAYRQASSKQRLWQSIPRGLKIRLTVDYAFALMARLYPKVDAFRVLKTVEGIESLPQSFAYLAALVCFYLNLPPWQIGLIVFAVIILLSLMTRFGFYVFPSIVKLGTIYSYLSGFGILFVLLAVFGFYWVGWRGVLAYFAARLVAGVVNWTLTMQETRMYFRKVGQALTGSERNFFNAYRLHASALGITTDVDVTDEETASTNWEPTFLDLATKYPDVVARFTVE
jgi:hypothetical protein